MLLVVGLGLGFDLVSCWLLVMQTDLYRYPLSLPPSPVYSGNVTGLAKTPAPP